MKTASLASAAIMAGRPRRRARVRTVSLVPLAMLSGAWTVSLARGDAVAYSEPGNSASATAFVPAAPLTVPASVSAPKVRRATLSSAVGSSVQIAGISDGGGIPDVALAAYQRAANVINAADSTCHIPWQLIAAIGQVESDHGRFAGSDLTADGIASPGIYGVPLDGRAATALIRDTDAGELDQDPHFDRAVGPMQFIPSTWAVVGVDADGDGLRNPQDIDDAGLAAGVYLCSGNEDLGVDTGRRSAVYRYNHSNSYVELVLALTESYTHGGPTTVPGASVAGGQIRGTVAETKTTSGPDGTAQSAGAASTNTSLGKPESRPEPENMQPDPDQPRHDGEGSGGEPPKPVTSPALPLTGIEPVDDAAAAVQDSLMCALVGFIDNPETGAADMLGQCAAG